MQPSVGCNLCTHVQEGYWGSFFFYLDFIATISLIPDVVFAFGASRVAGCIVSLTPSVIECIRFPTRAPRPALSTLHSLSVGPCGERPNS